ncbi:ABC transporter substrate-binding protein [Nitrospirillum sp. BR 11752]|uniref:ABC transporter substrate-binding protein n=1 Tax=Nitrospirillum sp. BR 11752 TaxID=3104293 RepID=UPI002EA73C37|nr:ABC transporter substrate-binding protein [Nitrospirillum sp. BR 11752]
MSNRRHGLIGVLLAGLLMAGPVAYAGPPAKAPDTKPGPTKPEAAKPDPAKADPVANIAYLALTQKRVLPQSFLDQPPDDDGVQGARLALADNTTTGRFIHQAYHLEEALEPDADAVVAAFKRLVAQGYRAFVTDVPADLLLRLADLAEAKDATLLDATTTDDALRGDKCRRNVLHLLPSRAMLADALMQYLAVKNWRDILLVAGPNPEDKLYADALRKSARKFRLKIVADKPWTYDPGARRTDTGHYAIGAEVARFTQGIKYDVLVVADEGDNFGDELGYRATDPRPVAGTQGLVPAAWARPFEQWGATQLQARFLKQAGRWMTERDYGAWMAVRALGEAATRGGSVEGAAMTAYLRKPEFELAAFKGARLSFRAWDGQLRQPVLLADARSLVSVSPQPGFLHETSELDTLGPDQPETTCHPS